MLIDAHQHLWQPVRGDYDWMPKDNAVLNRAYAPADLEPVLCAAGIDGTVLVQAAASVQETEYMLGLADATSWIKGVVGWIDFERPAQIEQLERFACHPKFLGVRPMIQDIPDPYWMLSGDVQWGFEAVCDLGLTFDALGFPRHLDNFLKLVNRYPEMRVVLDHGMKPQIRTQREGADTFSRWADGMRRLAEESDACCKLSGLVTESGDGWATEDLRPFVDHLLECYGPTRLMWGSDWPVCRLQAEYDVWLGVARALTSSLSDADQSEIFGGTACRFYRLT